MRFVEEHATLLASIFVVLIIIYLSIIYVYQNSYVTDKEINNYAQTYIEKYKYLVETYISLDNRTYLKFYNESPYFIRAAISITHGAGLEFIPSKASYLKIEITDKQIEEYFFNGNMSWEPRFAITKPHISITGGIIECNGHPFVKILENVSLLLHNATVNGEFHNCAIIKGSNRKKDWTNQTASEDASSNFEDDLISAFTKSEEFRQYLVNPILTNKANEILDKQKRGYYANNYLLFKSDYEELYNIAKEYMVNSQFVDNIYNFNEDPNNNPSLWEQYDPSGILRNILGGILGSIIIALVLYYKNRIHQLLPRRKKTEEKNEEKIKSQ